MASILTTLGKATQQKGVFGSVNNAPIYLQFVPGVVVDVATHPSALKAHGHITNINSIIALPHIQEGPKKTRATVDNDDRYYPLMRGVVDVPTKGDPVLLCSIGGIQYYLGPLNTQNNPNFNLDNLFQYDTTVIGNGTPYGQEIASENNRTLARGESLNFKKVENRRLAKIPNEELDNGVSYNETYGDLMLEGRHGNSLRMGSRDVNPYIIISNSRPGKAVRESFGDGSLISITKDGTLAQHYGNYKRVISSEQDENSTEDPKTTWEVEEVFGFTLASDYVSTDEEPPNRYMGDLISSINGGQDTDELIYNYSGNQILFSSDRLTLNSKLDDIFLSSNKDIHVGAKENVTISTAKDLIIESEKTHLGDPNKKEMDNMVLGSKVQEALNGIIGLIKEIQITTQLGPQSPMPLPSESSVTTMIDDIISKKHFIEK